ncbi:fatty acid desaturase [Nostoc sp. FACHB-133]|uniref:fatty acid desaturase n=1 Tax=Nostoc sp. FACHB-133 TaxID=2692835 RepID=UPI0016858943|nr:fatty acid desaturase [Nostoc sp. FACHB-133]MBD2525644.1 fatty acid desaturase [Nostoc sp. FACHB-133]
MIVKITERLHRIIDLYFGIFSASIILSLWLITFIWFCSVDISKMPLFIIIIILLFRVFLHTGVFIVAHDAAHGVVLPQHHKLNHVIGYLAIYIYALLPYKQFVEKHWMHHRYPASSNDPDYHDGHNKNVVYWYIKFMRGYLDWKQNLVLLVWMSVIFHGIRLGLHVPGINLIMFWVLPLLLSSMQMFYFGTYLPHREPKEGYTNIHHANSNNFSVFWSLLTSYHFGYHWEHHEYPDLPWFKLPSARNAAD